MKKISLIFLAIAFFASVSSAAAEDVMQRTLRDSLYGGLIGAPLGTAGMFLTDRPGDNIEYIPPGAAVGILAGAAYGMGRSMVQTSSVTEVDGDGVRFSFPTVTAEKVYDEKLDQVEEIEKIDLVRLRF